jgi:Carboxypeptidase Taq (M32) metallopeptidase
MDKSPKYSIKKPSSMEKVSKIMAKRGAKIVAASGVKQAKRSLEAKLVELKRRLLEIGDLEAVSSVLSWDHATYMPQGGAAARARQGALLSRLRHERLVDPELGKLLDGLTPYAESLPYDSDTASLIRVARRDFEKAKKLPPAYIARRKRPSFGLLRCLDEGKARKRLCRDAALP